MWFKRLLIAAALLLGAGSPALPQGTQFPSGYMWGNSTAAPRSGKADPMTLYLDRNFGSTQGMILSRGASSWGAAVPAAPKILRYSALGTTFTPDATATLLRVWIQGGGGGGSGNNASNHIPYSQYGRIGTPSAFGEITYTATITNASPGIITATASNATCNQPFFLTTTGALPTGYTANTTYYVQCGNDGNPAPGANTFAGSLVQYQAPLTCAVYAPFCQNPINTSSAGSGVHTLHLYRYVAQAGSGGGIVGDQAVAGSYVGCDSNGPAGYVQSVGLLGGNGDNTYGINITGSSGGAGPFGGAGTGGAGASNQTGAGGAGATPTFTSSAGGGGASGGWCYIVLKPSGTYPLLAASQGAGGIAGAATFTVTIATPAVFTSNSHFFGPNAVLRFTTTGALPTGLALATDYYVSGPTITANTFQVSTTPNGAVVNTSGTQSGVHTIVSGYAGGTGGHGQVIIEQLYGAN